MYETSPSLPPSPTNPLTHSSTHSHAHSLTHTHSYPPIFESPDPPTHARTNCELAYSETGLNVPVEKYGPTGHVMQYSRAFLLRVTPRKGWKREEIVRSCVKQVCSLSNQHIESDMYLCRSMCTQVMWCTYEKTPQKCVIHDWLVLCGFWIILWTHLHVRYYICIMWHVHVTLLFTQCFYDTIPLVYHWILLPSLHNVHVPSEFDLWQSNLKKP